jgi:hypothetical protein
MTRRLFFMQIHHNCSPRITLLLAQPHHRYLSKHKMRQVHVCLPTLGDTESNIYFCVFCDSRESDRKTTTERD